jgi:hypothetical protein
VLAKLPRQALETDDGSHRSYAQLADEGVEGALGADVALLLGPPQQLDAEQVGVGGELCG